MFPIPPTGINLQQNPGAIIDLTRSWSVGQILKVQAQTNSDQQGQLLLKIGRNQISATSPIAIKAGEYLNIQVKELGELPVLNIVSKISDPAQVIKQYLRLTIPKQADIDSSLQRLVDSGKSPVLPTPIKTIISALIKALPNLDSLSSTQQLKVAINNSGVFLEPKLNNEKVSTKLVQQDFKANLLKLHNEVSNQLKIFQPTETSKKTPDLTEKLNSHTVKTKTEMIRMINVFAAGKISLPQLANALHTYLPTNQHATLTNVLTTASNSSNIADTLTASIKALILTINQHEDAPRTYSALRNLFQTLPLLQELQQATESALSRVQTSQLLPLAREAASTLLLLIDLPVKLDETTQDVQMRFDQQQKDKPDESDRWSVTLNFNLPNLGPIEAKAHLNGDRVSALFSADRTSTTEGIHQHLHLLQQALSAQGLQVDQLISMHKPVTEPSFPPKLSSLFDEHA